MTGVCGLLRINWGPHIVRSNFSMLRLSTTRITLAVLENRDVWTIVAILLILWLLGFSLHIAGGLIHILLVVGLVVIIFRIASGRRALG